ncbi:ABC transporter permease [Murimonas intestini]|uniref:ABC transport system permease protein n=1 Tax=Murimonas intestini TaxID=1337051 RepID=A0AB73T9D1_9FIRM|nr:FtsX-like permease family protein [Murimonas intestini]MCR1839387.1 FtsX-like permease family protein [Murimonas intestini]MCR1864682.1 FtsX-like permease family protein [Murimonas intestini]MCR1882292.1 FtsX-like permease family protein [Murimonas intestini]
MNFINRAWLYIVRKKGKSTLLFIVFLVMATLVLTALSLGSASETARENLKKSIGGKFLVACDYSENNPYLKIEQNENGMLIYTTQQISPELVEQIRNIKGVEYCSAEDESLVTCPDMKWFAGNVPIVEEFRQSAKIIGTWKSSENSLFTSGRLTLAEGRHITPEDHKKVLISKDLAEKNDLKTGDTIRTEKGFDLEIAGLFIPRELESVNEQVTTYDKIQNLIITDLSALVEMENGPSVQGFKELEVSVLDPEEMESIMSQIKEIQGVDWKGFTVTEENDSYESTVSSLKQLSGLASAFLVIILVASVAVLSLILTLWARGRVHETGVLLSAGIRKSSILGQYMAELMLIAFAAFLLSYFSSSAAVSRTGELLAAGQKAFGVQEEDEGADAGSRGGSGIGTQDGIREMGPADLEVTVQLKDMILLFLAGLAVISISAGIASVSVMRLKPREILAKMS